jgi:hypothetical protein
MSPRQGDSGGSRREAEEVSALGKKGWTPDMLRQTTEEGTEFAQLREWTRSPGGTDYPAGTSLENVLTWRQQRDARKKPMVDPSSGDPLYENRPDHQVPTPEKWFAMEQREIDHANGWRPSDANKRVHEKANNAAKTSERQMRLEVLQSDLDRQKEAERQRDYKKHRRENPEFRQRANDYHKGRREDPEFRQRDNDTVRAYQRATKWAKDHGESELKVKAAGAEARQWLKDVWEAKGRLERDKMRTQEAGRLTLEQQLLADQEALQDYKAGGLAARAAQARTGLIQGELERRIGVAESALGASGMEQQLLADQEALQDYKAGGLAEHAARGRTGLTQEELEQRIGESEAQRRAFMMPPWLR